MARMSVASVIIKFGGVRAMARALGHEYPTRVQGWKRRGVIPVRQQYTVLQAAQRAGLDIGPLDLMPHDDAADEPGKAA